MFKSYKKIFTVSALGVLTTGLGSSTASAHTLVIDFKNAEGGTNICADNLELCTEEFHRLMDTIAVGEAGGDEGGVWGDEKFDKDAEIREFLSNMATCYDSTGIAFKADAGNDKCVIVLKNGTVVPEEFKHLLGNINFPFEVVFEKIGGEFGFPSGGFANYVTSVGFIDCGDLELTEEFFDGMREYDKLGCIKLVKGASPKGFEELKRKNKNEIIEPKPSQVNVAPKSQEFKPQEFKTIKDEPKLPAPEAKEEPKENELSAKATSWINKQGGVAGAAAQLNRDFNDLGNLFSSGAGTQDLWKGIGQIFKIKELGYKPGQGKK